MKGKTPWKWNPYNGSVSRIFHYQQEADGTTVAREERTTAILVPQTPLDAATKYCITITETVAGETKDAMGVAVESHFVTSQ